MAKWPALLVVLAYGSSAAMGQETSAPSARNAWGGVSGRVVFDGDLQDPALRAYQGDLNLYAPMSIQDDLRGVAPRLIGKVPNHALPIDPRTRGIKNVFVYLKRKPEQVHPSLADPMSKPVEVVCRDHLFVPRALIVEVGQKVRMLSPDGITNFRGGSIYNAEFNPLVTPDKPAEWTPQKPERLPMKVQSDVDRAAVSWWLVLDHPYAFLTGPDGSFRLEKLPVGDHELTIWQEIVGYVEKKLPITIRADTIQELPPAKITAEQLKRR
jgi:hypothetical protein